MKSIFQKTADRSDDGGAATPATDAPLVLVVDDSPTETHILIKILTQAGYRVETATNGDEGIEMARAIKPALILMDVVMPVTNGFQATRILRKDAETSSIPIILVTTKDQQTDRTWGLRQGASEYLLKPVDRNLLLERIRSLIGG